MGYTLRAKHRVDSKLQKPLLHGHLQQSSYQQLRFLELSLSLLASHALTGPFSWLDIQISGTLLEYVDVKCIKI